MSPALTHRIACALATFALLACGDDDPREAAAEPAPAEEPAAPRPALPGPRAVAGPGAFDLTLGGGDAQLILGQPSRNGGGIEVQSLDPHGAPRGEPRTAVPGETGRSGLAPAAIEIDAEVAQGRLGLAWVERAQLRVRTRAAMGDEGGRTFGAPSELEERDLDGSAAPRGQVVVVASDAGMSVLHRRADGPCESGGSTRCARFAQARLGEQVDPRNIGWSLPVPCARPIVGAATVGAIRYHALCALGDDGDHLPATTAFAIQFEPRYAHAEKLLEGCAPAGLTPFAEGVAVMGDCDGSRRGFRMHDAGRAVEPLPSPSVRCAGGRPLIAAGAFEERLEAPRDGLAPLLPTAMAGANDRAVWTGEAILVATTVGEREVVLRRYACDRGTFRRTDP